MGNQLRVLISELSGRKNIMKKMATLDLDINDGYAAERALVILERVKKLESMGYTFEGADASVELMILHSTQGYCKYSSHLVAASDRSTHLALSILAHVQHLTFWRPKITGPPFQVLDYTAQVYDTNVDSASRVMAKMESRRYGDASNTVPNKLARATVKVRVLDDPDGEGQGFLDHLEVSEGSGPVDALANALKRALVPSHPELAGLQLVDYKVRILDPESATCAATRVMIEFKDEANKKWTTVSVDRNIISASLNALVDGFEYALKETVASCVIDDVSP